MVPDLKDAQYMKGGITAGEVTLDFIFLLAYMGKLS